MWHFPFLSYSNYCGISNHKTIIEDADYNIPYSKNKFTDYNN